MASQGSGLIKPHWWSVCVCVCPHIETCHRLTDCGKQQGALRPSTINPKVHTSDNEDWLPVYQDFIGCCQHVVAECKWGPHACLQTFHMCVSIDIHVQGLTYRIEKPTDTMFQLSTFSEKPKPTWKGQTRKMNSFPTKEIADSLWLHKLCFNFLKVIGHARS